METLKQNDKSKNVKIEFVKELGDNKVGDVIETKEKEAQQLIKEGYVKLTPTDEAMLLLKGYDLSSLDKINLAKKDIMANKNIPLGAINRALSSMGINPFQTESPKIVINPPANVENAISILDIFQEENRTQAGSGTWKMECPHCGLQGGRTEGFILFPDNNTAYCHTSGKHFWLLEAYALRKKIINCLDGRETGDNKTKILGGELFTLALDEFKNEYGTTKYNDLIEQLKIRKRVEIPGNNRLISDFADELGEVYKSRNILFYRGNADQVVRIGRYITIGVNGEVSIEKGFEEITPDTFVSLAEMLIHPWTATINKFGIKTIITKSMTQSHASLVLSSENFKKKLLPANRIFDIQIPIIYKNELTFPKRGYDKRFGSWLPYNAPQIKLDMLTFEESKKLIDKIFEEFCFEKENDRIHAIAAFITPFCRGLFPEFNTRTPIFIYMANRERAGKDYCAGCTGMLYEGVSTEEPPISNDEGGYAHGTDEFKKKIMACMIQGRKRFHSSNNKGLLNNAVLEAVTTCKVWNDRILGQSKTVTFNNEIDYSLSGNLGIRLTPDLHNRSRIINLHLVDEDANARIFSNPKLHEWILENRIAIISALYKLVENWVKKGMPPGSAPFTSFPDWARVVGGIMECAGYMGPCEKDEGGIISLDIDTDEMKQLFEEVYKFFPEKWIPKEDIRSIAAKENIMTGLDINSHGGMISFGIKLDKYVNRKLSGILLKIYSRSVRTDRRQYMFCKENFDKKTDEKVELKDVKSEIKDIKVKDVENFENFASRNVYTDTSIKRTLDGGLSSVGGVIPSVYVDYSKYGTVVETPPTSQTLPPTVKSLPNEKEPQRFQANELKSLQDFTKKANDYLQKEADSNPNKNDEVRIKTDRELQFWEAPECADIVEECTKEEVFEWVKKNPGVSHEQMYDSLGIGSYKFINELVEEKKIKQSGEGWEVDNV